jgi:hypothetical protein
MMETLAAFVADPAAESTMLFGAMFFTFMFMFFLIIGVTGVAIRRADIRKRIFLDRVATSGDSLAEQDWEGASRSLRFQSMAGSAALLANVERGARGKEKESEKTRLQRELVRAGFFGANGATWFTVIRIGLTIVLPVLGLLALAFFAIEPIPAAGSLSGAPSEAAASAMPRRLSRFHGPDGGVHRGGAQPARRHRPDRP